jgi:hypothetical protein
LPPPDLDRDRECFDFFVDPTDWESSLCRFSPPRDPDRFFFAAPDRDRDRRALSFFFFCSGDRDDRLPRLWLFFASLFLLSCFEVDRLRPPPRDADRDPDRLRDAFLLGMGDERFFLAAADRDRSLR